MVRENLYTVIQNTSGKINKYYLGDGYPGVYLRQQEARCMLYFIKGYSYSKTGMALNISPRTVESYSRAMQDKLKCRSKQQLIEKVLRSNFLGYLDEIEERLLKNKPIKVLSLVNEQVEIAKKD